MGHGEARGHDLVRGHIDDDAAVATVFAPAIGDIGACNDQLYAFVGQQSKLRGEDGNDILVGSAGVPPSTNIHRHP